MICVKCKQERSKIDSGRRYSRNHPTKLGGKIYVDQEGRSWSGKVCPCCRYGTEARTKAARVEVTTVSVTNMTKRKCRKCRQPLPADRYFTHEHCAPQVEYLDFADIYGFSAVI